METLFSPKSKKFDIVQQKIGLLAQSRLQNLGQSASQRLQNKLCSIDQKLSQQISSKEQFSRDAIIKLKQFSAQICLIQEKSVTSKRERSEQLAQLKAQLEKIMIKQNEKRREIEKGVASSFEQNIKAVENQLTQIKRDRKQQYNIFNSSLAADLPDFREELLQSIRLNDIELSRKITHTQSECQEFRESLKAQAFQKQSSERKLMDHLKSIVGEIKQTISCEKNARQQNKIKLLTMLDQAKKSLIENQ